MYTACHQILAGIDKLHHPAQFLIRQTYGPFRVRLFIGNNLRCHYDQKESYLEKILGQPVNVTHKPGGAVAWSEFQRTAKPDGTR